MHQTTPREGVSLQHTRHLGRLPGFSYGTRMAALVFSADAGKGQRRLRSPGGRLSGTGSAHESDDALIDRLHRGAFAYFMRYVNPLNGLVADTSRAGAPSSIAVVGFALTSYIVGVERGWLARNTAAARTLVTLRFFLAGEQRACPSAIG